MKCSESWLREWVDPKLTQEALCDALTMAGLEVEGLAPAAEAFTHVIVGQVLRVEKHPEADHLYVCKVDVGSPKSLQIVCGATNVKTGMKTATALLNAVLPNQSAITRTIIRGISSEGMLCSAKDLGLAEESQGLMELPRDAPIGQDLWAYLQLADTIIDVAITPNRGDCLSVKGITREISAITQTPLKEISIKEVPAALKDVLPVTVQSQVNCPRYLGRIIRNVKADIATPAWLKERLRRSGVRSISPIVDVTNYVMLELGQPMHAFDLNKIKQGIQVRQARKGEKLALLDGSAQELNADTLVIADHEKPLAMAGVMGGLDSSVTLLTNDIFLESAYFSPQCVARQRQQFGLSSESAYRFERGVDPSLQRMAMERASQLILEIVGGNPGPIIEIASKDYLPQQAIVNLPANKIKQVLGIAVADKEVERILSSLGFVLRKEKEGWLVTVPSYRFDAAIAEDLIEEIARLYGYEKIPTHRMTATLQVNPLDQNQINRDLLRQALNDQGYHEAITYSFIDKKLQNLLDPEHQPQELVNPITAEMTVMRTNLWGGLINTWIYNKSRQRERAQLFEIGTCFIPQGKDILQETRLAGLITGSASPEQWGMVHREADFFDLKGHVKNLLKLICPTNRFIFKSVTHPALHPGQTAGIYHQERQVGIIGVLHPFVLQALDLSAKIFVFELYLDLFQQQTPSRFKEISKFPEIRRDIAVLVNHAIPSKDIQDTIKHIAGYLLKDVFVFDVYQGKGVAPELKSIALALVWQHPTRTLVDEEVTELMERAISTLKGKLGAELRS